MSYENKAYLMLKEPAHPKPAAPPLAHHATKRSPRSHTSVYNVQISKPPFGGHKDSSDVSKHITIQCAIETGNRIGIRKSGGRGPPAKTCPAERGGSFQDLRRTFI